MGMDGRSKIFQNEERCMAAFQTALARLALFAFIFLGGCSKCPQAAFTDEEVVAFAPATTPKEVRVLTINVWSGLTYKGIFKIGQYPDDPERRYKRLIHDISRLSPDVIAVQEANPLPNYVKRLSLDLGYREIHHVSLCGIRLGPLGIPVNLRDGEAILVKRPWTLVDLGGKRLYGEGIASEWCCFHFSEITNVILGRAVINGKPIYIYSVHLHSGPFRGPAFVAAVNRLARDLPQVKVREAIDGVDKDIRRRAKEIENLLGFIRDTLPPGMPAMVVGDFNADEESGELDPLLKKGRFVDSFRLCNPGINGATWDPKRNPNFRQANTATDPYQALCSYHERYSARLDYILLSADVPPDQISGSRVVLTPSNGMAASDHYGVLTTLRW
jgi:endonuclease/exonuclease/phosphatase family metal-dependent hydrolase